MGKYPVMEVVCHLGSKIVSRLCCLNRTTINITSRFQFRINNTPSLNNAIHRTFVKMEDLMVLCKSAASIYELPLSPTSNGQIQPITAQLDEVGSQKSKDVDLDAEGYIHHFRDSSPQEFVSLQKSRPDTSVMDALLDDVTNKPDSRHNTTVNFSSSESGAECYTLSSNGVFKDAQKNPAVTPPCLIEPSKELPSNESSSKKAGSTADYAAMRSMVRAPPDPTIWGNKMMTIASTRPISDDTEDYKATQDPSITGSPQPGPVNSPASRPSMPQNAYDVGDRNTTNVLDVTVAGWADPSTGIPSNGLTSDAAGLATQAWVDGHWATAEYSDASAVSGRHGTHDRYGSLGIQDNNHINRVFLDRNQGDQYLNSSGDSDQDEPTKASLKVGRSNGEPNMQRSSRLSNSQDTEQDDLLAVSLIPLFKGFRSLLTPTQSLYLEICDLQQTLRDVKSRARVAEEQLSDTQSKMVGTYDVS